MNRPLSALSACAVALCVAASAHAESRLQFGASGFLDAFDAFINQQESLRLAPGVGDDVADIAIDFSSSAADELPAANDADRAVRPLTLSSGRGFTPRAATLSNGRNQRLFVPSGGPRVSSAVTPRRADAHIAFSYTPAGSTNPLRDSFGIALVSSVSVEQDKLVGVAFNDGLSTPLERRSYNVGLNIGYWGFNLDASIVSQAGGLEAAYEGFDVGLSYRWSSWSTRLAVGEYSRRTDLGGDTLAVAENPDNDFYTLELGAAYDLNEALRFSGGVKLFEYGDSFGLDEQAVERSQMVFLGTKLSF